MFTAQTVLSNVMIASLIGGLAWIIGRSGRRAGLAHVLWVAFFIKLITPPLLLLPVVPVHSRVLPDVDWWIGLGTVWLVGFAFFAARGMVRSIRFHFLLKREGIPDPESAAFVASLLVGTRHGKGPEVKRLPLRLSPMLFGFSLHPIIVYPEPLWAVLSEAERHAFLAHETAHFYRRDHWVRWLEWCVSLLLIHPVTIPVQDVVAQRTITEPLPGSVRGIPTANGVALPPVADRLPSLLPESPRGFWNQPPPRRWANFALSLPGAHLVADVDQGIRIDSDNYPPITFAAAEVSAIVEIPATRRVVIGTASGTLRLWDLTAGMPVSFIGQHASGVTSIAYHATGGLVSGDQAGVVNRWDLQSGQILASWSDPAHGIQSIRYADDGKAVMILTGDWRRCGTDQAAHLVDSRSFQTIRSWPIHCATAVVMDRPRDGWVAIDWSGRVRQLETDMLADTLSKNYVSSLVLSQDTRSTAEELP